jgi:hypothetical protein
VAAGCAGYVSRGTKRTGLASADRQKIVFVLKSAHEQFHITKQRMARLDNDGER